MVFETKFPILEFSTIVHGLLNARVGLKKPSSKYKTCFFGSSGFYSTTMTNQATLSQPTSLQTRRNFVNFSVTAVENVN